MGSYIKYDFEKAIVYQDKWDLLLTAKSESIMSLGNGYLGLRSTDEEPDNWNKEDLFINGIFNRENPEEVPELANLADSIKTPLYLDGQRFILRTEDKYTKKLHLNTAVLEREIIAKRHQKSYQLHFERFVSQDNVHLYFQKITIKQLSGEPTKIEIVPQINGQTTNNGAQHLQEGKKRRFTPEGVSYQEATSEKNIVISHNLVTTATLNGEKLFGGNDNYFVVMQRRNIGFKISCTIAPKKPFVLEKLMSINTSQDKHNQTKHSELTTQKLQAILTNTTYEKQQNQSIEAWKSRKSLLDFKIHGQSEAAKYAELANSFAIFHLNSCVPRTNPNLSVAAKGLSGEGYQGHTFWDTEMFIFPSFLYTDVQIARNLLEYRYRGIKGARKKAFERKLRAAESRLNGAQYPWETALPEMGEVCPYWGQADLVTGHQEPIASRRQEIHVSAAIAYAVQQYYDFTEDEEFMVQMGYEMIIDTAIFWVDRAELIADGTYVINDVMGPNEYKGNINNNAYTNAMAKYNIDLALAIINKLQSNPQKKALWNEIKKLIPYEIPVAGMKEVSKKLVQQIPDKTGLIAENDSFLKLSRNSLTGFRLRGDAGKKLFNSQAGQRLLSGQIVKQADVILLTLVLNHLYDYETIKRNFEFYEPITTHDSSLSPTTYAIQAIKLRKMKQAYELYKYSLDVDLGTNMHSSDAGVHTGALAASWQTTINGYGGVTWGNNELHLNPILPREWEGLDYQFYYKNARLEVEVRRNEWQVRTELGKKVQIWINKQLVTITDKFQKFSVNHQHA